MPVARLGTGSIVLVALVALAGCFSSRDPVGNNGPAGDCRFSSGGGVPGSAVVAIRNFAFGPGEVRIRRGVVTDIAKTLDDDCDAENIGIAKFGPDGAFHLVACLNRIVASGAVTDWVPRTRRALVGPLKFRPRIQIAVSSRA